jgi:hypothetical protein
VLEARGSAIRRHGFYMTLSFQEVERAGLRVSEQAIADMRRSLAAAEESGDTKDIGYATYFVGWAHWLRGERAEAATWFRAALEIAERVGESLLIANCLGSLAVAAVSAHDPATVAELAPRAVAAQRAVGSADEGWARAPLAWLAWQEGRASDVLEIAVEIEATEAIRWASENRYRWVHLFPVTAVHLARQDVAAAIAAVRGVVAGGQQPLPDAVIAAVTAACQAGDAGRPEEAARLLGEALELAAELGFL